MARSPRRRNLVLGGITAIVVLFAALVFWPRPAAPASSGITDFTLTSFLTRPVPNAAPNAGQLRRGQALVIAGDCLSCHAREGGAPFAGGLGLSTPFGTIFSTNITPDARTGIGGWDGDKFYRAMHDGVGRSGNLYPAMPYPQFSRLTHADDDAILAYLKSLPAVDYRAPDNRLPFPINLRVMVNGWNLLFFKPATFQADASQSAEWNRGAYLVTGPGHCGACHTPKNALGADQAGKAFRGGDLDNWVAPDLTGNSRTGLGGWNIDDLVEFLKTGRNAHASAAGSMADVVTYSTSLMSDPDRHAIAVYLKSLPASPDAASRHPDPGAMKRGAAIYSDVCASCHLEGGLGQSRAFPPLGGNAMLQQADTTGLEHLILAGARVGPTALRPSPLTMPSFAWKLTDGEIADVGTYVRNSWGNRAAPLSAGAVKNLRHKLQLDKPRLTANSGDQN